MTTKKPKATLKRSAPLTEPEIRRDYIQDKYVLVAPMRSKRPSQFRTNNEACPLIRPEDSPFSPQRINKEPALAFAGTKRNWLVYVTNNKFAAVSPEYPKAYGHHELVVETPDPNVHLEDLPLHHVADILDVYSKRTKVLMRDKKVHYILIFKNAGGRAGASICHAHSQIFATEFIPPHIKDKSERALAYQAEHGTCVYCDVIAKERKSVRLVWEDNNVVAFCPYASVHNYEIWIIPKRHHDNITNLSKAERLSWARILRKVLFAINHKLQLPYNYYFHQYVDDTDQHVYMKVVPRGSAWAGVEIGSGLIINPVPPEDAAVFYREHLTR